ncbi:MAG: S41 family peptidase [Prevotella sp.]|nr:S41 family peptidase [Prevotella sp.]
MVLSIKTTKTVISKLLMLIALVLPTGILTGCVDEEEYSNTPKDTFEALWKIIDERYCFFDYKKQEYGLDWNKVYNKYNVRISNDMSNEHLFEVLSEMLGELRDGHVNLSTSYDFARYWKWHENYPSNFSDTLLRRYLGTDYRIAAGLKYKILDDNIGYIYYESFTDGIGEGNLDEVIYHFMPCRGLIIDVRNNGGGMLTNAEKLAARFVHKPTLVGYMQHKTGKGHSDFSTMEEQWLEPSSNMRWHKPVCVLTNRSVYSAANEFVMYMKQLPDVTIVGDKTGGGAGMPYSDMLPNGWAVRFSACPMYDAQKNSTEFGIEPHHNVSISDADFARGEDSIIEFARKLIR